MLVVGTTTAAGAAEWWVLLALNFLDLAGHSNYYHHYKLWWIMITMMMIITITVGLSVGGATRMFFIFFQVKFFPIRRPQAQILPAFFYGAFGHAFSQSIFQMS